VGVVRCGILNQEKSIGGGFMNFYNEDEKKAGIPVIPGAASPFRKTSAFGKAPMFSRAAGSFVDRLKNLSRRDMAFVAIGLSVLVMAPVAEYMISQPSQDNVLKGNDFAQRHGDAGPFEPGINGLSQGSADGSGEVITPLTSRDPASLILGSQSSQPVLPPAVTAPPSSSWRDAVTDSGRAAFTAAAKSVGAPTVIPRMSASLRGFTSFGGDGSSRTSGSLSGGKIIDDAKSASSKAAKRSMIGPVAMAGYKGVATGNPNSSSKGAFEKLRGAADKSASNFSGGSAMNSLDKAAADAVQIGAGAGGAGGLGEGEKTKGGGNYDNKYKHERSGESLAEAAAKARQQKALEWEFFKKYEIKKTIVNAVVNAFATTLGEFISGNMKSALGMSGGGSPAYVCLGPASGKKIEDCHNPAPFNNTRMVLPPTTDSKVLDSWTKFNQCPCGYHLKSDYYASGAAGGTTGADTTTTNTGAGTGTGTPEQIAVEAKSFDEALFAILQNVKEGVGNRENGKKLWKNSVAITDSKTGLSGVFATSGSHFETVLAGISGKLDTVATSVNAFEMKALEAETKTGEAAAVAEKLMKDIDAKLAAPIVKQEGSEAVDTTQTESMQVTLRSERANAVAKLADMRIKKDYSAYLKRAAVFYNNQIGVLRASLPAMRQKGDPVRTVSEAEAQVLAGITEDKANEKKTEVQASFDKLWKSEADPSAMKGALDVRGAKKVGEWKMDDKEALDAEAVVWEPASPLNAAKRDRSKFTGANLPVNQDLASVIKRAKFELPDDVAGLQGEPAKIIKDADDAIAALNASRTALGLGAATPNPVTPNPVTPNPVTPNPVTPNPVTPNPVTPNPVTPNPVTPNPVTPNPNAASPDQVAKAEADLAIIRAIPRYGVGVNNGARNCSNAQSSQISQAYDAANNAASNGFTKDEVSAIAANLEHACDILQKCNPRGATAAGCN
jgi:hypothetical protein